MSSCTTPLDKTQFAKVSCLEGAVFGVQNSCDTCIPFNACLQNQLEMYLSSGAESIERTLGYNLSPRYHKQEILWYGDNKRFALNWKGVSQLNVKQQISDIAGFGPFTISPFILQNITLQNTLPNNFCEAVVDASVVENPERITFWDSDGNQINVQHLSGYPKLVGGNWIIPLDRRTPDCLTLNVNVHSCDYMVLDVELPVGGCTGEVLPVYIDTETPIHVVKTKDLGMGVTRYYFYTWSLVNPAFKNGVVELSKGQFYKLYTQIAFKCFSEVEQAPVLLEYELPCNCCDPIVFTEDDQTDNTEQTLKIQIDLIFEEDAVIFVQQRNECNCDLKWPIKFDLYYKTDPNVIQEVCGSIEQVKLALTWWIASELDTEACGCDEIPMIAAARSPVDDLLMNPLTGTETQKQSYEKAYGKLKAKSLLGKVRQLQKRVIL